MALLCLAPTGLGFRFCSEVFRYVFYQDTLGVGAIVSNVIPFVGHPGFVLWGLDPRTGKPKTGAT